MQNNGNWQNQNWISGKIPVKGKVTDFWLVAAVAVHFSTRSTEVTIKRLLVKQQNWKTRASPKAKLNFHDFQIKPPVKQPISHCSSNFFSPKNNLLWLFKKQQESSFSRGKKVSYLLLASGCSFPQVYIQG